MTELFVLGSLPTLMGYLVGQLVAVGAAYWFITRRAR